MNRATYIDNNGFLRYEDNCKLVVINRTQSSYDNNISNEIYNTFRCKNKNINNNTDYEGKILSMQEEEI